MDGIILIDKEKEYTSHDVVAIVKKLTKSKVGHTGTLDPNATGVLPLLIGDATKVSKYLINHDKEYIVELELGTKTETADIEGNVLEEREVPCWIFEDEEKVKEVLNSFLGKQSQIPPVYSAIKVNGKKLYDYARNGQQVEIKPREIEIYKIEILSLSKEEKTIKFLVQCSKGTYIRSLCEDIAQKLGTVGYMKNLRRTVVGNFKIDNAIAIEDFKNMLEKNDESFIIPIEEIFLNRPKVELKEEFIKPYFNGVKVKCQKDDGICRVYINNKFIGIGIIKNNTLKRDIVLEN